MPAGGGSTGYRSRSGGLASVHVDGLEDARRALRSFSKESGREFDKEARAIATKVRDMARASTPKQSGRTAASIRVSSTYAGISVRSSKVNFGQHEFGRQIWLRRGLPYAKPAAGGITTARGQRGSVLVRQRPATPGRNGQARVINEGRYLIPRRRMLGTAANHYAPVLRREVEQMLERVARKYHLD